MTLPKSYSTLKINGRVSVLLSFTLIKNLLKLLGGNYMLKKLALFGLVLTLATAVGARTYEEERLWQTLQLTWIEVMYLDDHEEITIEFLQDRTTHARVIRASTNFIGEGRLAMNVHFNSDYEIERYELVFFPIDAPPGHGITFNRIGRDPQLQLWFANVFSPNFIDYLHTEVVHINGVPSEDPVAFTDEDDDA